MNCSSPRQQALLWFKRQHLVIGGVAIAGLGLAFGWNGLAAIGALPIVFSTVPCLIMMGLCMKSMQSCSKKEHTLKAADTPTTDAPPTLSGPSSQHIEDQNHA